VKLEHRLDQISTTIQELRRASADGPKSRQLIDALFRTIHTFKAATAAEGLTQLSRTAHQFEDLLHAVRTGKIALDDEVLHVFDETVIALRDGTQTSTLNSLNEATTHTSKGDDDLPAEFASLKQEERHRAAAARREGANLYVMNVEFEVTDFDERFRQLKERLEASAELISVSPTMHNDQIVFKVVYASSSEKIPVQTVLRQAILAGNSVAGKLKKNVTFVVRSEEFLLPPTWAGVLTDALLHLVRNAVDHGIVSEGTVVLEATPNQITVTDDGRGIAPEYLSLLFQPGFSTAAETTELSGRGVGLDVVKTAVEELGGSVSVTSEPGKGSSFKITIPGKI
jgi:two-component system chemotaxis sensor kinase CheA